MKECDRYLLFISREVDGDLSAEERDELSAHLKECARCAARLEIYRAMKEALSGLEEEPPAEMARGVLYRIEKDKKRGVMGRFALPFTGLAAAAAALLLILSGAFGDFGLVGLRMGASKAAAEMDSFAAAESAPEPTAESVPESAPEPTPEPAPAAGTRGGDAVKAPRAALGYAGDSQAPANGADETGEGSAESSAAPRLFASGVETDGTEKPEAPDVPFSRTFSVIAEVYGADDTLFSQYEREQVGDRTYILVPSTEMEAFIADQPPDSITVYREGDNIDPEADTALVIWVE